MTVALALRMGIAVEVKTLIRGDEVYQALEPAHRLWTGWGIIAWEWRDGIRSWLLPGLLALIMRLSGDIAGPSDQYLTTIALVMSFLSLGAVASAVVVGWHYAKGVGACLCGVICACWPELVFTAAKTLPESVAAYPLVVAVALASLLTDTRIAPSRFGRPTLPSIGFLLGLTFSLRIQLAPAILVVALWTCRMHVRDRWLPLVVAGLFPVLVLGAVDYATWGSPFQSVWKNYSINLIHNRAASYGTDPFYYYAYKFTALWGTALLVVTATAIMGFRRAPLFLITAFAILASHSLIAHKEASFVFPAIPLILITAGLGTAEIVLRLPRLLRPIITTQAATAAAAGVWVCVAALTYTIQFSPFIGRSAGFLDIMQRASTVPGMCGFGLYGSGVPWNASGGYSYLNKPVPFYLLPASDRPVNEANYLVYDTVKDRPPAGWQSLACSGRFCLAHSDQPCIEDKSLMVNAVLEKTGE